MPEFIQGLPGWGLVVVALFWTFMTQVLPRINRGPRKSGSASVPSMPAVSAVTTTTSSTTTTSPRTPDELREIVDTLAGLQQQTQVQTATSSRLEQVLERHFEVDRQQFELLRAIAARLESDGRVITRIADTLSEVKGAMQVIASTQEAIFRRVNDDTGRHHIPR